MVTADGELLELSSDELEVEPLSSDEVVSSDDEVVSSDEVVEFSDELV